MKVIGFVLLVIAILCIAPMILLWTVNSLAVAGGATFYIEHTVWNYVYAALFIATVRGN